MRFTRCDAFFDHTLHLIPEFISFFLLIHIFDGKRIQFQVKLHTPGTDFQNEVWNALHHIPYGSTTSYGEQAKRINRPTATRAVASANGHNRIAIIIPCHRVIGKDGSLTGYGGGLERKKWLLDFEKSQLNN